MEGIAFTYPFSIAAIILLAIVVYKFINWFSGLTKIDKVRILKNFATKRTLIAIKESFGDGLFHISIFKRNKVLGYMHMSLAFGWFLLIIFGHLEVLIAKQTLHVPFYESIFSRYFDISIQHKFWGIFFTQLMDFLLLFILSGVVMAYYKRLNSRIFGMRRTTKLKFNDRIALISLWLIFPLRLLAESATASITGNGGFLTNGFGWLMEKTLPVEEIEIYLWWSYSFALGIFFVILPNSRYAHIPTEIFYIFLRNYGIRLKKKYTTFTDIQIYSCSRCGMCLDICQLDDANIHTQSVYLIKHIRNRTLSDEILFNCLLCGRCQDVCPVHIELNDLRITQRIESTKQYNSQYLYLKETKSQTANVVYFAGCMTHLTAGIKQAMKQIFAYAKEDYWFMDEEKSPCCGRPLMQAGQFDAAMKLIINNYNTIVNSNARKLVVSCPICLKTFKQDYHLVDIEILHHSQYINQLIEQGKLPKKLTDKNFVYHDPCELGRASRVYEEPRRVLNSYGNLIKIDKEKQDAFCCGGSLANFKMTMNERDIIKNNVLEYFLSYKPDYIVTSCPLCKKTFSRSNNLPIKDIAEIVVESINNEQRTEKVEQSTNENVLV